MARFPASSVEIKKINVALMLKGHDLRRRAILDCLRPSVTLEGASGKCRTIVMTGWHAQPRNWFDELERAVKFFSGDKKDAVRNTTHALWKTIKAAIYAEARRKSIKDRFETARRRTYRTVLLGEVKSSLTSLSKKEIAKYIRPKDLADVWKQLQKEKMVEEVMDL